MIPQRIRIFLGDAGYEPGTSASEVWCTTNEPPHLFLYVDNNQTKLIYCDNKYVKIKCINLTFVYTEKDETQLRYVL